MKRILNALFLIMSTNLLNAQALTDWHCHNVTADFLAAQERNDALMDESFPIPKWSAEEHLAFMDEAEIATAVLSMPAPQPWWGDGAESQHICRQYNEQTAALCRQHKGRFLFVAALPLPDVALAVEEADFALRNLGAVGVKMATNSRGLYLGDPKLEPLMAKLNALKATVVIHPHKPQPVNDRLIVVTPMAMHEYLAETTRAVMNMISYNVPARYPEIRFIIPHCGSFLPLEIPRYKSLIPLAEKMHLLPTQSIDIEANLKNFYFDIAGAPEPEVIRSLLTITTPDHLLYGSDYPYVATPVLLKNLEQKPVLHAIKTAGKREQSSSFELPSESSLGEAKATGRISALDTDSLIVRIAEIEVHPEYLEEYLAAAKTVGAESVAKEPGVICIFPTAMQRDSKKFRIIEIYASREAYQSHLKTPHFLAYKQGTLHMVKSFDLVDVKPMNAEGMWEIFRKFQ